VSNSNSKQDWEDDLEWEQDLRDVHDVPNQGSEEERSWIAELNRQGVTFLVIEHDMALVARLCAHVFVMAGGRNLAEGTPAEVVRDARVIEAYLGGGG